MGINPEGQNRLPSPAKETGCLGFRRQFKLGHGCFQNRPLAMETGQYPDEERGTKAANGGALAPVRRHRSHRFLLHGDGIVSVGQF